LAAARNHLVEHQPPAFRNFGQLRGGQDRHLDLAGLMEAMPDSL
jgi:hypothetical protein